MPGRSSRSTPFAFACAIALGMATLTGSSAGCFGPTEIDVELTTTVPCEKRIQTQLFTGARGTTDFGAAPAAETDQCASTAEPRIGTLSIVPSGARDDAFDLQVVAGVGVAASTCTPGHRELCIVARRRATFLKHKALRVPVLLSDRCIGVVCGEDETCDLGLCAKVDTCTDLGCPREQSAVPADAGVDGPLLVDATVPDADVDGAVGPCGPVADVVASGQDIRGQLAMQGADLVYVNGSGSAGEVRRVPRKGGTPVTLSSTFTSFGAVAATDVEMYSAAVFPNSLVLVHRALDGSEGSMGYGQETKTALALTGTTLVGISDFFDPAGIVVGFHAFTLDGPRTYGTPALPGAVPEVIADADGEWYGVSNGVTVLHFAARSSSLLDKLDTMTAAGDIAVANKTLYVAMSLFQGAGVSRAGIHAVPRASVSQTYAGNPIVPGVTPLTMAADSTDLYYIDGISLSRLDLTMNSGRPLAMGQTGPGATALTIDASCLYWVEGGSKIMKRARR
jgi:hypothetical protein